MLIKIKENEKVNGNQVDDIFFNLLYHEATVDIEDSMFTFTYKISSNCDKVFDFDVKYRNSNKIIANGSCLMRHNPKVYLTGNERMSKYFSIGLIKSLNYGESYSIDKKIIETVKKFVWYSALECMSNYNKNIVYRTVSVSNPKFETVYLHDETEQVHKIADLLLEEHEVVKSVTRDYKGYPTKIVSHKEHWKVARHLTTVHTKNGPEKRWIEERTGNRRHRPL